MEAQIEDDTGHGRLSFLQVSIEISPYLLALSVPNGSTVPASDELRKKRLDG